MAQLHKPCVSVIYLTSHKTAINDHHLMQVLWVSSLGSGSAQWFWLRLWRQESNAHQVWNNLQAWLEVEDHCKTGSDTYEKQALEGDLILWHKDLSTDRAASVLNIWTSCPQVRNIFMTSLTKNTRLLPLSDIGQRSTWYSVERDCTRGWIQKGEDPRRVVTKPFQSLNQHLQNASDEDLNLMGLVERLKGIIYSKCLLSSTWSMEWSLLIHSTVVGKSRFMVVIQIIIQNNNK